MRVIPPIYRCALVAVAVGSLSGASLAQFGGGESEENSPAVEPTPAAEPSAPAAESPPNCHCLGETDSQSVARINAALAGPLKEVGLEFQDEPLESVVNFLQDNYDVPIQIDVEALQDVGLSPDEPVTINVRNVTLKSALRLLLKPLQLTYVIANEVLIITTPEEAESQLVVCVYDVRDLVSARNATKELEHLAEVIVACIAGETWAKSGGGEAEIRPLRPGLLVVSQTRAVHDEIASLFAAMRKILHQPGDPSQPQALQESGGRGGMMGRGGYGHGFEGGYGGRGGYAPQDTE